MAGYFTELAPNSLACARGVASAINGVTQRIGQPFRSGGVRLAPGMLRSPMGLQPSPGEKLNGGLPD